jgi:hypothetical protein
MNSVRPSCRSRQCREGQHPASSGHRTSIAQRIDSRYSFYSIILCNLLFISNLAHIMDTKGTQMLRDHRIIYDRLFRWKHYDWGSVLWITRDVFFERFLCTRAMLIHTNSQSRKSHWVTLICLYLNSNNQMIRFRGTKNSKTSVVFFEQFSISGQNGFWCRSVADTGQVTSNQV